MDLIFNDAVDALNVLAVSTTVTSGGPFAAAKMHLFQQELALSRDTVLATLTAAEATYTGYNASGVTWSAPTIGEDGTIESQGVVSEFRPSGTTVGNSIYGFYLTNSAGTVLLACANLANGPVPMNGTTNNLVVIPRLRPDNTGIFDQIS